MHNFDDFKAEITKLTKLQEPQIKPVQLTVEFQKHSMCGMNRAYCSLQLLQFIINLLKHIKKTFLGVSLKVSKSQTIHSTNWV